MELWHNLNIAKDLQDYIKVLQTHAVDALFNVSRLIDVANSLPDQEYYTMEEVEIEFYLRKAVSQARPKIKEFKISLINSVSSYPVVASEFQDPLDNCAFDMVLIGFGEDMEEYVNCWHLDKDIYEDGDKEHKYTHPRYHFQFGGKHMASDLGGVLLMGAPRIPHPPMDIFLAIHFVLNNYYDKKDSEYNFLIDLYEDTDYQDILERAKKRLWYPYFRGLSRTGSGKDELVLENLFPLAV